MSVTLYNAILNPSSFPSTIQVIMGGQISSPKAAPAMEPQAKALCDVLEAIFDYADANLEPKSLGLMPIEKLHLMAEKAGMFDLSKSLDTHPWFTY